jgi:hypothetical protein
VKDYNNIKMESQNYVILPPDDEERNSMSKPVEVRRPFVQEPLRIAQKGNSDSAPSSSTANNFSSSSHQDHSSEDIQVSCIHMALLLNMLFCGFVR